jgi:glycosyltransferase involved in cell wall biosynthesis
MRILIVLTYYRPHTSGLTIYAERLAKAWVERGHQVTVLTSRYRRSLPADEIQDGVKIVRAPVLFRISKGVIMPTFGILATKLVLAHDVIQLHLPQFDAAGIALRGRILNKPTVVTYHCDLTMPKGVISWAANQAVHVMNRMAAIFTHRFVAYTKDYAEHSPLLSRYMNKLHVIRPPVDLPEIHQDKIKDFAGKNNPERQFPIIGMASRFATEKGIEVLLDALPRILATYPNAMVQFAGTYENIIGEEHYYQRLIPRIREYEKGGHWKFLGNLNPESIAAFYPNLDVLVMPSLNSTEAFGLVQIEAMINGIPTVASNLPGVRRPSQLHKMGIVIPIGDSNALAEAIVEVVSQPEKYRSNPDDIAKQYQPISIAVEYEKLFHELQNQLGKQLE